MQTPLKTSSRKKTSSTGLLVEKNDLVNNDGATLRSHDFTQTFDCVNSKTHDGASIYILYAFYVHSLEVADKKLCVGGVYSTTPSKREL